MPNALGPPHGQRNPRPSVVETGFGSWKRHTVVAGNDHDGVIQFTQRLQLCDRLANNLIEVLNLNVVVQQIVADHGVIRKVGWHDYLRGILSRLRANAKLESAV